MRYVRVMTFVLVGVFTIASHLVATPDQIHYQGRLTHDDDTPVADGTYAFTLRLYPVPTGGTPLWIESQDVTTHDGQFSIFLGEVVPIPDSVFPGSTVYLGVTVDTDPEMSPRTRLVSVPYAYKVSSVDAAGGGTISGSVTIEATEPDSVGNILRVVNANGQLLMTITADNSGAVGRVRGPAAFASLVRISLYEPVDSKAGLAVTNNKIAELNSGGLLLFGQSEADTTLELTADGNVRGKGGITLGENSSGSALTNVLGANNSAAADTATISGGYGNYASGIFATIGGGLFDTATGHFSTISGGSNNNADGRLSTVGGGGFNRAIGTLATIGGGGDSSRYGGLENVAEGYASTVSGGFANLTGDSAATVGGGAQNRARGAYSVIAGGGGFIGADSNSASGSRSSVCGGARNHAQAAASSIGGGFGNITSNILARIGGGSGNIASGQFSTVAGGVSNEATGDFSFIGGGGFEAANGNEASGPGAVAVGGLSNMAGGALSAIGGGSSNSATGTLSSIPGGGSNAAIGWSSFAAGIGAKANHHGTFVLAAVDSTDLNSFSDSTPSGGPAQIVLRADSGIFLMSGGGAAEYIPSRLINTTSGAYLSAAGVWTNACDEQRKENFSAIDGTAILEKLSALDISEWNYVVEDDSVRHVGPTAQGFRRAFELGDSDKAIATVDTDGIALAAIKALNEKVERLSEENKRLRKALDRLSNEHK